MLRKQLSMNLELVRCCNELEKLLHKQQSSPNRDHSPLQKRVHDLCNHNNARNRHNREMDEFLESDRDLPPLTRLKSVHMCNFTKCINTYILQNLGTKAM